MGELHISYLLFPISISAGAQSFACDAALSTPLCPGSDVECSCTVKGTTSSTRWVFQGRDFLCPGNIIQLAQAPPCLVDGGGACGPYLRAGYEVMGVGVASCSTSTSVLHIVAHDQFDELIVECWDMSRGPGDMIGNISLHILGTM